MNITTSTSGSSTLSQNPAGPASSQQNPDTQTLPSDHSSTDSAGGSRDILQESTITSEGKNSEKNAEEGNHEAEKSIIVKEEFVWPPPHMLEPQTSSQVLTRRSRPVLSIEEKAELIRRIREGEPQKQLALEYGISTSTVSDLKKNEAEILRKFETGTKVLTKRRRTVLSLAEKADLIRRMHEGESQKQLALEYGIGTSTVSDVKKNELEILRNVEANGEFVSRNRTKLEPGTEPDVEEAILEWLLKEVSKGREVSGAEVMARARQEHHRLRGSTKFRATAGWLERFKRRHNIRAFKPGQEGSWRRTVTRPAFGESSGTRGRRRGRSAYTMSTKVHSHDSSDEAFDVSSPPSVKSEADSIEESEYLEYKSDEHLHTGSECTTFQPVVRLEEAHFAVSVPPVEEIPSASEAAIFLSKALVWAAAQQDSTPQELFVMKELQTKAAMRSIGKSPH